MRRYHRSLGPLRQSLQMFLDWVKQHPEAAPEFLTMKRDGFRCVICGRGPAGRDATPLHAQHIIPVSVGGETSPENLRTLCDTCEFVFQDLSVVEIPKHKLFGAYAREVYYLCMQSPLS